MKAFVVGLLLVALAHSAVCTEKTPEQLQKCMNKAEGKAKNLMLVPQIEKLAESGVESVKSLKPNMLGVLAFECDEIVSDINEAIHANGCGKALDQYIADGKVTVTQHVAHAIKVRDFCIAAQKITGPSPL